MTLIRGGPAGPNGAGGAWDNEVESDRAALWDALGARQGIIRGLVHSGVAGQMALSYTPGSALLAERDAQGNPMDSRGYHAWTDATVVVSHPPASAAARNDAVVAAWVDVEDGPIGTGVSDVGPQIIVVPGVSGTTTPRTDAQINAAIGRGGWVRMLNVPVASGATQINTATIEVVRPLAGAIWTPYTPYWGQTNGVALAIGNGSHTAEMCRGPGGVVDFRGLLIRGSTTNVGAAGAYAFRSPTVPANVNGMWGNALIRRTSPFGEYVLAVRCIGADGTFVLLDSAIPGRRIGYDYYAWAEGDQIAYNGRYREAA